MLSVAPFAGAWIEINDSGALVYTEKVAPFAGAWIEIYNDSLNGTAAAVAPFAGAWIEIGQLCNGFAGVKSLPSRERGLK